MFWPGRETGSYVCPLHAARAQRIARAMGFALAIELLDSGAAS